jgi:hypothetical protein
MPSKPIQRVEEMITLCRMYLSGQEPQALTDVENQAGENRIKTWVTRDGTLILWDEDYGTLLTQPKEGGPTVYPARFPCEE